MRRGPAIATAVIITVGLVAAGGYLLQRGGMLDSLPGLPSSPRQSSAAGNAKPAPYLSPLTGRPSTAGRQLLAVKIDNVRPARPQTGLPDADVVYVEPVEGGLSRIMAIFASKLPDQVGPVRSARASDVELLAQFGHPVPGAYSRSASRPAPHNLFASPAELLSRARDVSQVKDIGFRFGTLAPGLGTATKRRTIGYGASSTSFTWSAAVHTWQVSFDGRPATSSGGSRLGAATVVIQHTDIASSDLHDVLGNPTPYTLTVGSGKATVLRNGVAITGRWSRPSPAAGTTFSTPHGASLLFAPGQVWVIYAP